MKQKNNYVSKAVMAGAILGLGAPLGYVLYAYFLLNPEGLGLMKWCFYVLENQMPLLVYLTVPTIVVFSCFGYYHGQQESRLDFKTQQMDHFLSIAVHDVRSPLAVMGEAVQTLKDKILGPITPAQEKYLDIMQRQGSAMAELVTEILDIHKMESGQYDLELRPTKILPLINKAAEETELILHKKSGKIHVQSELDENSQVFMDAFRIRQVVRNIIGNAIRYMPDKGTIQVRLFHNQTNELEISIQNGGEHIPEEKLKTIFNKFTQAKNRDHKLGYGLGLSICKNIMDLHQGRIWAENLDPQGVCFHICFHEKLIVT